MMCINKRGIVALIRLVLFLICVCVCCTMYMQDPFKSEEGVRFPLELESQMVVSCHMNAGN